MDMEDNFSDMDTERQLNDGKNPVTDIAGNVYRLTAELSRGGQGVVYRTGNSDIVVKIDLTDNKNANALYTDLRLLPIPSDLHITLPILPLKNETGYVMRLLDDMESFSQAFRKRSEDETAPYLTSWLNDAITAGGYLATLFPALVVNGGLRRIFQSYMHAAGILAELHSAGLVYCDFSANNVFVSADRDYCNVWLIDADNVCFAEQAAKLHWHTPIVAAPEVCSGQKGNSFSSDVFAFASSLFQQLLHRHPFEGAAYEGALNDDDAELNEVEDRRNSGEFPYILDDDDDSNFVDFEGLEELLLHARLSELFLQTFGIGRLALSKRPLMSEWALGLAESFDRVVHCPTCGMDFIFDSDNVCCWCDAKQPLLVVKSSLSHELWTFAHEISDNAPVNVPMRIVHGYIGDEVQENVFRVSWNGKTLKIVILRNDIECYTTDDKKISKYEVVADKCKLICNVPTVGLKCSIDFEVMA